MSNPFASPDSLRGAFADGLERLAAAGGAGSFVLAAANARFDPLLWARLKAPLTARFAVLAADYRARLAEGRALEDAPDDVEVFLKLALLGVEELAPLEERSSGPWEVQCNPLRALRPPRMSGRRAPEGIRQPFDPGAFHFNKPFMTAEALWQGELFGRPLTLFYNKFPFAPLHGLLVPERQAHHPQFLQPEMHAYVWELTEKLGRSVPGLGFGYNALGAGASINHLHVQMFVRAPLPVEAPCWTHTEGGEAYPAAVHRFTNPGEAWSAIEALHRDQRPYNLLYRPGYAYLFPRLAQGGCALPDWCPGLSWYELAGAFVTFSRTSFDALDSGALGALLRTGSGGGR